MEGDWGKEGDEDDEEVETDGDEEGGGSIMVLRGVVTLGRLLGFRWGLKGLKGND